MKIRSQACLLVGVMMLTASHSSWGGEAAGIAIWGLKTSGYTKPMLSPPIPYKDLTEEIKPRYQKAFEDYAARQKKRWLLKCEAWPDPNGKVESATCAVIYGLVETSALAFEFKRPEAQSGLLELLIPQGPELGEFAICINQGAWKRVDPYSNKPNLPLWVKTDLKTEFKTGSNLIQIRQHSPQDTPIWLRAFRLSTP